MSEATMSDYIKGFDAGYAYALNEVEQWIKREEYDPRRVAPVLSLLAHLKVEDKDPYKLKDITSS
jgi:hypothetical protein